MTEKEKRFMMTMSIDEKMNEEIETEAARKNRSKSFIAKLAIGAFLSKPDKEKDKLYP